MSIETSRDFVNLLKQAEIVSDEMVALWTKGITDNNPVAIANHLVENGHLTNWQANQLLSGKHSLKLGNFILLRRLVKDDVGTQYAARQVLLDRQVKVTVLNRELSRRLGQRRELVKRIATVADFDHKNLEHLHLIDREGDRYLLVSDLEQSHSLDDSDLLAQLKPSDVSRILSQSMNALAHVHQSGLSHGTLTEKDISIGDDGNVTIHNSFVSWLVHNLAADNPGQFSNADSDTKSMVRIGKRLVTRLLHDEAEKMAYGSIFDKLQNGEIKLNDAASKISKLSSDDAEATNKKTSTSPRANDNDTTRKNQKTKSTADIWKNPNFMLTLNAILLVAISLALYYSGWFAGRPESEKASNSSTDSLELPSLNAASPMPEKLVVADLEEIPTGTNLEIDTLPGIHGKGPSPSTDKNEKTKAAKQTVEPGKIEPIGEPISSQEKALKPQTENSLLGKFKSLVDDDEDMKVEAVKSNKNVQSKKSSANATVQKDESDAKQVEDVSAEELKDAIELPATEKISPISIGSVKGSPTLKLIADENVASEKLTFEIRGDSNSGWTISSKNSEANSDIATVSFDGGQLFFAWDKGAAESYGADYLRNCILKIVYTDSTNHVALRRPVVIENFKFDRSKPQLKKLISELKYPPAKAMAQLLELDEEIFGELHFVGDENRHFSRKKNLEVHFSDLPEYQLFHLVLSSDLKKKISIGCKPETKSGSARKTASSR